MNYQGLDRLIGLLSRSIDIQQPPAAPPGVTSYEQTTRQMVQGVEEDVRSLRRRLDALIFMVMSAILAEAASRFIGG